MAAYILKQHLTMTAHIIECYVAIFKHSTTILCTPQGFVLHKTNPVAYTTDDAVLLHFQKFNYDIYPLSNDMLPFSNGTQSLWNWLL